MRWIECSSCWAEFRVISDFDGVVEYCPYCGAGVEDENEDDYDSEDE